MQTGFLRSASWWRQRFVREHLICCKILINQVFEVWICEQSTTSNICWLWLFDIEFLKKNILKLGLLQQLFAKQGVSGWRGVLQVKARCRQGPPNMPGISSWGFYEAKMGIGCELKECTKIEHNSSI